MQVALLRALAVPVAVSRAVSEVLLATLVLRVHAALLRPWRILVAVAVAVVVMQQVLMVAQAQVQVATRVRLRVLPHLRKRVVAAARRLSTD